MSVHLLAAIMYGSGLGDEPDGEDLSKAARAIIRSGYRKPRMITTMDELLALNDQAVIKTRYTFMQVDAEHSERVYLTEFGDESSWPVRRNKPRDYGEFLPAVVLDEGKGRC